MRNIIKIFLLLCLFANPAYAIVISGHRNHINLNDYKRTYEITHSYVEWCYGWVNRGYEYNSCEETLSKCKEDYNNMNWENILQKYPTSHCDAVVKLYTFKTPSRCNFYLFASQKQRFSSIENKILLQVGNDGKYYKNINFLGCYDSEYFCKKDITLNKKLNKTYDYKCFELNN